MVVDINISPYRLLLVHQSGRWPCHLTLPIQQQIKDVSASRAYKAEEVMCRASSSGMERDQMTKGGTRDAPSWDERMSILAHPLCCKARAISEAISRHPRPDGAGLRLAEKTPMPICTRCSSCSGRTLSPETDVPQHSSSTHSAGPSQGPCGLAK